VAEGAVCSLANGVIFELTLQSAGAVGAVSFMTASALKPLPSVGTANFRSLTGSSVSLSVDIGTCPAP
jgi:hypothetical protein